MLNNLSLKLNYISKCRYTPFFENFAVSWSYLAGWLVQGKLPIEMLEVFGWGTHTNNLHVKKKSWEKKYVSFS